MKIKMNFNNPLPDEYEKLMPDNLSPIDRYEWRKHKVGELRMNGLVTVDEDGVCTFVTSEPEPDSRDESVEIESTDSVEIKKADETVVSEPKVERRKRPSVQQSKRVKKNKAENEYEFINNLPKKTMDALRRMFPASASKADLISAAVYILTDGECEISDKAMELVNEYNADDKLISINERLSHLERIIKRQSETLQAIELCTCFNTFDRRYGSNEPRKSPKLTEFREKNNLDMLERLREQARDQMKIDELARGRQIYNQIKDKND